MSRFTSSARATLACAALVLAAGCSSDTSPIATYEPDPDGGAFAAQLIGVLQLEANCVTVRSELNGEFVPVFPSSDVNWKDSTLTYLGKSYRVGDEVTLDGGPGADPEATIPEDCEGTKPWLVSP